jgi:hypothetical protein
LASAFSADWSSLHLPCWSDPTMAPAQNLRLRA